MKIWDSVYTFIFKDINSGKWKGNIRRIVVEAARWGWAFETLELFGVIKNRWVLSTSTPRGVKMLIKKLTRPVLRLMLGLFLSYLSNWLDSEQKNCSFT